MFRILLRSLILAASFRAVMYGDDITIPVDDGTILIQHAQFIRTFGTGYKIFIPELSFALTNKTSSEWTLDIHFHIEGICGTKPQQWTQLVRTGLVGPHDDQEYKEVLDVFTGRIDGCKTESITASLVQAENRKWRINGVSGERVDLEALRKQREAEQAAEDAERVKKEAAEAARQKRLAAERKKKQAEVDARYAKAKAEQDATAAEERRRVRTACGAVYQSTADKKIGDLTVREEQQVRACQALGLYPPH